MRLAPVALIRNQKLEIRNYTTFEGMRRRTYVKPTLSNFESKFDMVIPFFFNGYLLFLREPFPVRSNETSVT